MQEIPVKKAQFSKGQLLRAAGHGRDRIGERHASGPVYTGLQPSGNQALQRMLRSGAVQAKLVVNEPGDEYEREADRVADQVMSMPEPAAPDHVQRACPECEEEVHRQPEKEEDEEPVQAKPVAEQITPLVQRQTEPEEEEEEPVQAKPIAEQITPLVQRQANPEEEEEEPVQAMPAERVQRQEEPEEEVGAVQMKWAGGGAVSPGLEAEIRSMRGSGQSLPKSLRSFFEPRLGYDFSQVRIHDDQKASEAALALNSRAFAFGRNIVFGEGQYSPRTVSGCQLIGHELAHFIQQNRSGTPNNFSEKLQRSPKSKMGTIKWYVVGKFFPGGKEASSVTAMPILPGSEGWVIVHAGRSGRLQIYSEAQLENEKLIFKSEWDIETSKYADPGKPGKITSLRWRPERILPTSEQKHQMSLTTPLDHEEQKEQRFVRIAPIIKLPRITESKEKGWEAKGSAKVAPEASAEYKGIKGTLKPGELSAELKYSNKSTTSKQYPTGIAKENFTLKISIAGAEPTIWKGGVEFGPTKITRTHIVLFEKPNQYKISDDELTKLDSWFFNHLTEKTRKLINEGKSGINVIGHASRTGTANYNFALADKRAKNIKDFLVKLSLRAENEKPNIHFGSRGFFKCPNREESQECRKVEIKVEETSEPERKL